METETKMIKIWANISTYHDSSSCYNAHEEVGNQRSYNHHEALYHRNAEKYIETEVDIMRKSRPKFHQIVSNSPSRKSNGSQEWEWREKIGYDEHRNSIIPVEPFSIKYLFTRRKQSMKKKKKKKPKVTTEVFLCPYSILAYLHFFYKGWETSNRHECHEACYESTTSCASKDGSIAGANVEIDSTNAYWYDYVDAYP